MEAKLAEYRARRMKEGILPTKCQTEHTSIKTSKDLPTTMETPKSVENEELQKQIGNISCHQEVRRVDPFQRKVEFAILTVKFAIWCLLMTLFVHLEFGAVFFVFSVFYLMYKNFRTTPKAPGEVSAYSVFNPNCENIDGALTAAQFERELMFRQT